jgi:hypothetical protein
MRVRLVRVICLLLAFVSMICIGKLLAESDVAAMAATHVDQMPHTEYPLKRRLLPGIAGTKHQSVELPTTDTERLVWCQNLRQQYAMTPDKNTLGMCIWVLCIFPSIITPQPSCGPSRRFSVIIIYNFVCTPQSRKRTKG